MLFLREPLEGQAGTYTFNLTAVLDRNKTPTFPLALCAVECWDDLARFRDINSFSYLIATIHGQT